MFPIAGVIVWLFLGGMVGFIATKVTGNEGSNALMANIGVGWVSAVFAGSLAQFLTRGDRSDFAFWVSIAVAAIASVVSVAVFRVLFPRRAPTLR